MKVVYVLIFCTSLYVLATDDTSDDRKKLKATNILIQVHIDEETIWDKIKYFACHNNYSMEQLTFIFALPEQDYDNNPITQHRFERELQVQLLIGSGYNADRVHQIAHDLFSVNALGMDRRIMLKPVLRLLIIDIIIHPGSHDVNFSSTCRIIGLFMSTKFPTSYTKTADVLTDNTCVICHGETDMKSYKYVGASIHAVDNDNHAFVKDSIVLELG
ncbi:uncharacterized protein LOC126843116 isoform X1 [Adelges cooleyi]|uniref:uncharacterized protein LOC126843116 isoform X1 n=1 Tax=Adelges cooleyi TaxID=133065 RepID=UPI0021800D74|nr:uncharacterized protein LOC126843116 isoform X1 [Adelges cooleyi]